MAIARRKHYLTAHFKDWTNTFSFHTSSFFVSLSKLFFRCLKVIWNAFFNPFYFPHVTFQNVQCEKLNVGAWFLSNGNLLDHEKWTLQFSFGGLLLSWNTARICWLKLQQPWLRWRKLWYFNERQPFFFSFGKAFSDKLCTTKPVKCIK